MSCLSWIPAWILAGVLLLTAGCNRQKIQPPPEERQISDDNRVEIRAAKPADPQLARDAGTPAQDSSRPGYKSLLPGGSASVGDKGLKVHKKADEADALFTEPTLVRVQIEISRVGMNALRQTPWGNGQDRPTARATIREGGVIYSNVAVHLKGAAGSFRQVDDRPALTLNFDKFTPGQNFHGLHKISLNNSVQDPSYLCEKISRELFLAAGVPVPRAAHALVQLNGRDLGLYVLLEGANKQFLKRYFRNANGNLYDGGFCREIGSKLALNSGDNPGNDSGLVALCDAIHDPGLTFARLQRVLDVDRFMSMMAMEVILCHWDGYTMNRNNWRVFHDLEANRMVFIPHGLDQLFGIGRGFDASESLLPPNVSGDVARALLRTREGAGRYRARAAQLCTNVFKPEQVVGRIDEIVAGITPVIAQTHPQIARSFRQQANWLEQRILRRGEVLARHAGNPMQPLEFGSDGEVRVVGWKPSPSRSGSPTLSQVKDTAGKALLAINAGTGTSSSSWRARVLLGPGRYQFQGRVRVNGVTIDEGDPRGGAGLRISKGNMPRKITGTSGWTDCRYNFDVEGEISDVELICELRASSGNAWFDTSSLKLVRLQ